MVCFLNQHVACLSRISSIISQFDWLYSRAKNFLQNVNILLLVPLTWIFIIVAPLITNYISFQLPKKAGTSWFCSIIWLNMRKWKVFSGLLNWPWNGKNHLFNWKRRKQKEKKRKEKFRIHFTIINAIYYNVDVLQSELVWRQAQKLVACMKFPFTPCHYVTQCFNFVLNPFLI